MNKLNIKTLKSTMLIMLAMITLATLPLSAEWMTGSRRGEFGEETGRQFLFSLTDGIMSNTATTGSDASVMIMLEGDESGRLSISLGVHDYSFDNPVDGNILDEKAYWKFRGADGKTVAIDKGGRQWYIFHGEEACSILRLVLSGEKTAVRVKMGTSSYAFDIERENLRTILPSYLKALGITKEKEDEILNGKGRLGYIDFDKNSYLALRSWGLGAETIFSEPAETSFSYGVALSFDGYKGSHGAVSEYAWCSDGKTSSFEMGIGYGYRMLLLDSLTMAAKLQGLMSMRGKTDEYGLFSFDFSFGARASVEFSWAFTDDFYLTAGIADKILSKPVLTLDDEGCFSNTAEIILGAGWNFDIRL